MKVYTVKSSIHRQATLAILDRLDYGQDIVFKENSGTHKILADAGVMHWFTTASEEDVNKHIEKAVNSLAN